MSEIKWTYRPNPDSPAEMEVTLDDKCIVCGNPLIGEVVVTCTLTKATGVHASCAGEERS